MMLPPLALLLGLLGAAGEPPPGVAVVGHMEAPPLREVSGIVRSRRHPGIFWVHNDSGNDPVLYAIRADGSLVNRFPVAAANLDWEDIAADGAGNLYIGDIGNNYGILPIRTIYRLAEPDPFRPAPRPLPVALFWYGFGGARGFDAEGLVVEGDRALVVTKRLDGGTAELRAVPLVPGSPVRARPTTALGPLAGFTEPATGADLSPDGRRLAVCSTRSVAVYVRGGGGWSRLAPVVHGGAGVEAVCWDGDDLLLASEDRSLIRVRRSAWDRERARR
jgi:hypothetical protein